VPSADRTPPSEHAARPVLWRLVAFVVGVGMLLVGGVVLALVQLRDDTLAAQSRGLASLASASADELERGLQGALLVLQGLRDDLREARLPEDPDEAVAALHRRTTSLALVRRLWVVDGSGRVVVGSDPTGAPPLAGFAPALDTLADDAAAVSEPFVDLAAHETRVALALRYRVGPGGGGWLVGELPAEALLGALPAADLAADARHAVFRADGLRLAGTLEGDPDADGSRRLVQQRRTPTLGLSLVLTRDTGATLARWHALVDGAAVGVGATLLLIALLLWGLVRAERARWQAQRQAARAQRLDALGTLAGGVAHDFNNILASMLGHAEMARDAAPDGSAQARQLDQVLRAIERGSAVAGRILTAGRGVLRPPAHFAVQPLVAQVLDLVAGAAPPSVRIERPGAAEPPLHVQGDADALFQAVMNLCTNALQAMPDGGRLRVRVLAQTLAGARWTSHGRLGAGRYVVVEVADSGHGITPAVMERLFEPFFTTRGQAGTGLGLALVHGVAKAYGGEVEVDSTPGRGSRFALFLRRAAEPSASAPAADAAPPQGRGQRILVVDDEPELVALAEELLAALGYRAVGHADASAALAALQAEPDGFDLVITDERMPGLNGTDLAVRVRELRPELPVIVMSGWGGEQLGARAQAAGVTAVLAKPLRRAALARAVAAAFAR
jgi:signal transduction histidine kinase/CheY-like chemotaxis protein